MAIDAHAAAEQAWSRYDEAEGHAMVQCELAQAERDTELGVRPWSVTATTKHGPEHFTVHASKRELAMAGADAVARTNYADFITIDSVRDSAPTIAQEWFGFSLWYKDGLHIVDVVDYRRGFRQLTFSNVRKLRRWISDGGLVGLHLDEDELRVAEIQISDYLEDAPQERRVA